MSVLYFSSEYEANTQMKQLSQQPPQPPPSYGVLAFALHRGLLFGESVYISIFTTK